MAKMTLARIRKTAYPFPVYEAHFADGEVVRMSFWSQAGKPWDFDVGRRLCEHWQDTTARIHAYSKTSWHTAARVVLDPSHYPIPPSQAVAGYVYQDGRLVADDPKFSGGVVAMPRKRVTAAQLKARLLRIADELETGHDPLQCAQAARELLAA